MTAYRKQWIEPKEKWISKMKQKWRLWWRDNGMPAFVISVVVTFIAGIAFFMYHDISQKKKEFRQQVEQEEALCKPNYFSSKDLIAHGLFRITCITEQGQVYYKYQKTNLVMGRPIK